MNWVLKKRHLPEEGVEGRYRKRKHNAEPRCPEGTGRVCRTESSMTQQARTVYGHIGSEEVPRVRLDSTH